MTGNNEMSLNLATMRAIVQHYFDTVLFAAGQAPRVVSITSASADTTFRVSVAGAAECVDPIGYPAWPQTTREGGGGGYGTVFLGRNMPMDDEVEGGSGRTSIRGSGGPSVVGR